MNGGNNERGHARGIIRIYPIALEVETYLKLLGAVRFDPVGVGAFTPSRESLP